MIAESAVLDKGYAYLAPDGGIWKGPNDVWQNAERACVEITAIRTL